MEILRKRTHDLCDCPTQNNVTHKHMQFHRDVDDNIFGLQQKRKCNGVSSHIADHARERMGTPHTCPPPTAASPRIETDAMVTDSDATSYHSHSIPAHSMHHGRHVMSGGGDATNSTVPLQPQHQVRKVCQRCLSGEPGHITHIMS